MHPHFKLFPRVFVHKTLTVYGIFVGLGRQRHRPHHLRAVSNRGFYNLFYGIINNLRVISPNSDAQTCFNFFFWFRCQRTPARKYIFGNLRFDPPSRSSSRVGLARPAHKTYFMCWTPWPLGLPVFPNTYFLTYCITYLTIFVTTPAPTVLPPSRMAKRCFSSKATGTINFTMNFTVSPGITISVPCANVTSPVTSVVRI